MPSMWARSGGESNSGLPSGPGTMGSKAVSISIGHGAQVAHPSHHVLFGAPGADRKLASAQLLIVSSWVK